MSEPELGRWRRDDGMVTAETALALPAVIVVLAALVTVIVAVTAQLRCVAAAREGARAAARGEPQATVIQLAAGLAPDAATVQTSQGADTVTVVVSAPVRVFGVSVGSITVNGSATAQREPDSGAAPIGAALLLLRGRRRSSSHASAQTGQTRTGQTRTGETRTGETRTGEARTGETRPGETRPGERGSGTIYAAAAIGVLAALVSAAVLIGRAHVARSRADAAADLAALAAAQTLLDASGDPCARAEQLAVQNSATVTECTIDGETVVVVAAVPVRLGPFGTATAFGRARAGPVPQDAASGVPSQP